MIKRRPKTTTIILRLPADLKKRVRKYAKSSRGFMSASAFGTVVRRLREGRGLSLRETSQLSELDHAYVHRLETGAKEAPSTDSLAKLFRALKPNKRQEEVLRFLVGKNVTVDLVDPSIIDDENIAIEDFESAAQMSFRGKQPNGPEEWRAAINKIKKLRGK